MATENDDQNSTTEEQTTGAPPEGTESEAPKDDANETPPEDNNESEDEELDPKVLRKLLSDTRAEAANYRTKLREAETKLSEAKTPEEVEAAVEELRQQNAALERAVLVANVAREFELPSELAELLKGDDEAALKQHAKALQKFVPSDTPESLGGGLDPQSRNSEEFDPVAEYRKAKSSRY